MVAATSCFPTRPGAALPKLQGAQRQYSVGILRTAAYFVEKQ